MVSPPGGAREAGGGGASPRDIRILSVFQTNKGFYKLNSTARLFFTIHKEIDTNKTPHRGENSAFLAAEQILTWHVNKS